MSRKTIANLNIQLGASTAGLQRDFRSAEQRVNRFGRNVQQTGRRVTTFSRSSVLGLRAVSAAAATLTAMLGPLAIAAAAIAASVGSVRAVAGQFSEIDSAAKVADKLGLATEQLAGLRHAAELGGVGADTLDKSLQRMTRRISEAAQGSGAAKGALEELGLSAQALARMTPDQQLGEIAGAMKHVENQSDKLRLAFKLFDADGAALVNVIGDGRDALDEAAQRADELGQAISRTDAAKIEAANDALSEMWAALSGVAKQLAIALAPAIQAMAATVTDFAIKMIAVIKEWAPAIEAFGMALAEVFKIGMELLNVVLWIQAAVGKLVTSLVGTTGSLDAAAARNARFAAAAEKSAAAAAGMGDAIDDVGESMEDLQEQTKDWASVAERIEQEMRTPMEVFQDRIEELRSAVILGGMEWETYERAVAKAVDQLEAAQGKQESIARASRSSVGAVTRRSTAGFSAVQQGRSELQRMLEMQRDAARQAAERNRLLEEIASNTAEPLHVQENNL